MYTDAIGACATYNHACIHGAHMEVYPYCPDYTLFEHVADGMSYDKVFHIYTEILDAQYQMTRVDTTCLKLGKKKYFSRIFIANSLNNLPLKLVLPYSMFVTMMSRPQPPQITTDDDITNTQILERNSPETTRVG